MKKQEATDNGNIRINRLVRSTAEGVEFLAVPFPGDGDGKSRYCIPWRKLRTKGRLLSWLMHLGGEEWVTPPMMAELIVAVADARGWAFSVMPLT